MLSFSSKKSKNVLGLDISSSAVKLIELSRNGEGYTIEAYAAEPLQSTAIVENTIVEPTEVVDAIKRTLKASKSKCKNAAFAVADSVAITKNILMDADLDDDQMEAQILSEADQYIPYPLDEVAIDFEVQRVSRADETAVDVLLAACRKDTVDHLVDCIESSGLNPLIADVESYNFVRALGLFDQELAVGNGEIVAIVDLGAVITSLIVVQDDEVLYTREQLFGGRQLTEEIQRRYDMTESEAGRAKKHGGLPEGYYEDVLVPFQHAVLQHVTRSIQFYFSASDQAKVDRVVLAGGVASMEGLASMVEEALSIPTVVADPIRNMNVAKTVDVEALKMEAPALMIACGLAMREID